MFQIPFQLNTSLIIFKYNPPKIPIIYTTIDFVMPKLQLETDTVDYRRYKHPNNIPYLSYNDQLHSQK